VRTTVSEKCGERELRRARTMTSENYDEGEHFDESTSRDALSMGAS
jgi:hypothetical protein